MLKLLADENILRRLVRLLVKLGDQELVKRANNLGRAVLTRDSDFTMPHILTKIRN